MPWTGSDGFAGDMDPDPTYGGSYSDDDRCSRRNCDDDNYSCYAGGCTCKTYKYQFDTFEDLVTSTVFQHQLNMALAHKDKIITELRNEILDLHNAKRPHAKCHVVYDLVPWVKQHENDATTVYGQHREWFCFSGRGNYGYNYTTYEAAFAAANRPHHL